MWKHYLRQMEAKNAINFRNGFPFGSCKIESDMYLWNVEITYRVCYRML
jgi:hypothetical protein